MSTGAMCEVSADRCEDSADAGLEVTPRVPFVLEACVFEVDALAPDRDAAIDEALDEITTQATGLGHDNVERLRGYDELAVSTARLVRARRALLASRPGAAFDVLAVVVGLNADLPLASALATLRREANGVGVGVVIVSAGT